MGVESEYLRQRLCCPVCKESIVYSDDLRCTNESCAERFPTVDGVPVLINERASLFAFSDYLEKGKTFFDPRVNPRGWKVRLARLLYENSVDLKSASLLSRFADEVASGTPPRHVLVIGGGVDTAGLTPLRQRGDLDVLVTDISLGADVSVICDAHDIPFESETFDGVIAQAVLEHVVDPYRCVEEIHRVLKPDGIVFSDTPFMQQVHGGRYDFTRFTHLGQRRLFRRFEEIESGASSGPGVALTWSYRYLLLSFARSKAMTRILRILAKATSFWWKYFDRYLIDTPGALDAASAIYFLGRKSTSTLSDHALIRSYRGAGDE